MENHKQNGASQRFGKMDQLIGLYFHEMPIYRSDFREKSGGASRRRVNNTKNVDFSVALRAAMNKRENQKTPKT